jgi:hypothetical protein
MELTFLTQSSNSVINKVNKNGAAFSTVALSL